MVGLGDLILGEVRLGHGEVTLVGLGDNKYRVLGIHIYKLYRYIYIYIYIYIHKLYIYIYTGCERYCRPFFLCKL